MSLWSFTIRISLVNSEREVKLATRSPHIDYLVHKDLLAQTDIREERIYTVRECSRYSYRWK